MKHSTVVPVALSLLASSLSHAQAQEKDIYELITTAIHVRSSETALPVTVLSGDKLREAIRATLGDTLASQPGINNASFGPAVGQTVIRGQQGRRVMNLTNGLPNADASGNSADHAQTVEAILANSIEVLRGPSTLLYGGGAIGGVVNVIDRRIATSLPDAPAFSLENRHDTSSDLTTTVGSVDFSTANIVWHFDGLYREWNNLAVPGFAIDSRYLEDEHEEDHADTLEAEHEELENTLGYIANTGGRTSSGTGGMSWIFENGGHLGFAYNRLDNSYGIPPGAHGQHDEGSEMVPTDVAAPEAAGIDFVSIVMERDRYDVDGEWLNLAPWAETLSYKGSYTDYAHAEIEGNGDIGTRFSNKSWQHRLQLTHTDTAERHGVLGLQYNADEFAAIGEESFIPVTDINSGGLFLVEDFHAMAATIEIGGRLNRDAYTPQNSGAPNLSFNTYSLSGSALWDIGSDVTLGLSVSGSQRAPSVEELYSNHGLAVINDCVLHHASGSCEIGNTSLAEETSLNTDLTLYLDRGIIDATATVFYNRFNDYIGQITTGAEVDGYLVREYLQDDARFAGIEVDVNFDLSSKHVLRVFGDTTRGSLDTLGAIPRMPSARVGMELRYNALHWNLFGTATHAFEQDRPGRFELGTPAWTRVDIGADYTLDIPAAGELLIFIRGRNLGNEDIRLQASYLRGFAPEAGRSLETGVRLSF